MVARFGFAVASDVEPELLILDELLSVGDIEFQAKSMARSRAFLARGATLVLGSHAPEAVLKLCQRVISLHEGRLVADGPAAEVVRAFVDHAIPGHPQSAASFPRRRLDGQDDARESARFRNARMSSPRRM